jgi:glyceraldehyde 3-phosphate dehydrogenase
MIEQRFEKGLNDWIEKEKAASKLSRIVVDMLYNKNVELVLFRKKLIDKGIDLIISDHASAREIIKKNLTVHETLQLAEMISELDLAPSKIDLGRLGDEWLEQREKTGCEDCQGFVAEKLKDLIGPERKVMKPKDVILFGFGRIGRIAARIIINNTGKGEQLRLRGIVVRGNIDDNQINKRAELLRNDSIFGPFRGNVVEDYENKGLLINGQFIPLINSSNPAEMDYTDYGINDALLIDNTGAWRDKDGLSKHLEAKGVSMVLLTAPGKGDLPNVVYGVNHQKFPKDLKIYSAASCTTNAIVPPLKVIEDIFGIESGHIETVHSYTNDQNLLDNFHKKSRRGRAAPLNLVITETGAGTAAAKALPELKGKLTGNAVRIPTPDGSLAILNLRLKRETSKDELSKVLKDASLHGELIEQISFSENNELVSSDIIRNNHASIVDGSATIISPTDPKNIVLYVWYDNEWGYTEQVVRYAKYLSDVQRLTYY